MNGRSSVHARIVLSSLIMPEDVDVSFLNGSSEQTSVSDDLFAASTLIACRPFASESDVVVTHYGGL